MKAFLEKITDLLADAALLEMGVAVEPSVARVHAIAAESLASRLRRFFDNFSMTMADAALLEVGLPAVTAAEKYDAERETLEENLIEVAYAEAADYEDIHEAIQREHQSRNNVIHPDDCQYGDNDLCFA